ncbi:MAG: protein kinase [Thermoanaerobaculia bacterium]|nr:protein kinase [Thermoanaerobaculia bacterium]
MIGTLSPGQEALAQRLALARYDERDGLPQSQVQALAFDPAGFLWVGTRNGGLARFDGSTFRLASGLEGLSERRIDDLLADKTGRLWVAARLLYVAHEGRFVPVFRETFHRLALAPDGTVWAAGESGLVSFRPQGKDLRARRVVADPVTAIAADSDTVWVGRVDRLERTDLRTGRLGLVFRGAGGVNSILPEGSDSVLCGTNDGVWRAYRNGGAVQLNVKLPHSRVDALLRDEKGRVWVSTHAGTVRLSARQDAADLSPQSGLPGSRIVTLLAGPGGEIWLGGDGAGLFRFAPSRFAVVGPEAGLAELIPLSIAEDRQGRLWISTPRGQIACLTEGRFRVWDASSGLPKTDRFRDLSVSRSGRLDATWARGLVTREPNSEVFRVLPAEPGMTVNGGIAHSGDETWLATSRGLKALRGDRFVSVLPPPLGDRPVDAIGQDGPERVLASIENTVYSIDCRSLALTLVAGPDRPLADDPPWHLVRDASNSVWIASMKGAVRVRAGQPAQVFSSKTGLPDDSVDAVVADVTGAVWITTDKGIVHIDQAGRILRVYSFSDGLPAREGVVRSVLRDSAGRLWFGLVGALVRYDPHADQGIRPPPSLAVESVTVADRARGQKETVVDVSVIDFADPRGTSISWILGPHETAFSQPRNTRFVRWLGLPPGDYDLTIRAVDRGGRPGPPARVSFAVPALWYETRTARIFLAIAALALGAVLPAALSASARITTTLQAHLRFRLRELLSPRYTEILDDPFLPGSPVVVPSHEEAIEEILGTIRRAWNQNAILCLLGPPGIGKSTVVQSLEAGAGSPGILALPIPPARPENAEQRGRFLEDVARVLVQRQLVGAEQAARITGGGGTGLSLTRGVAELSSLLLEGKTTVLLVEDDPGELEAEAVRARKKLASLILTAGPHISLLAVRDVEPSLLAAEEPDLARVANLIRLQPVPVERAAHWLEVTAATRARFAPGVALSAVKATGTEPDRLRALGTAILGVCRAEKTNRVTTVVVKQVLESWDESPPAFLGGIWARLSTAERAVAAALGHVDRGEHMARPVGEVITALREAGFPLGPIEAGAIIPRLVEAGILVRCEDRIIFRSRVVARFVALHRPLSEERSAGTEVIGPYELLDQIGTGGMGVVHRARRLDNRMLVALKVIHQHLLATPDMKRRFLREGEIGVRVNHPGVVKVIERGVANGRAYIAMEFVPGSTIRALVARHGPFPVHTAARIVSELSGAVAALHAAGIVHRDIKSENVIVSGDGTAKILDFGLARTTETTRHTEEGHVLGTPDAMSPEQVRGLTPGPQADVWALGVVLYEMLTGVSPFLRETTVATMTAILEEEPEPLWIHGATFPEALDSILARALEKDVAKRWQSAFELQKALEGLARTVARAETTTQKAQ